MEQLKISRGNASMNLRALVDWGLIERVHKLGDRKEYFQADTDVWHMFETIMRERRRREVEPIIATIDSCCERVANCGNNGDAVETEDVREFRQRIEALRRFLQTMGNLFELVLEIGGEGVENLASAMMASGATPQAAPTPTNRIQG